MTIALTLACTATTVYANTTTVPDTHATTSVASADEATSLNTTSTELIAGHVSTPARTPAAGATVVLIQMHNELGRNLKVGEVLPTTTVGTTTTDEHGNYAFPQITRTEVTKRSASQAPLNYTVKAFSGTQAGTTFFSARPNGDTGARLTSSPDIVMEAANTTGPHDWTPPTERTHTYGCTYTLKAIGPPTWARINISVINGDVGVSQYSFKRGASSELGVGASMDFTPGVTLKQRGTHSVTSNVEVTYPRYHISSDASTQYGWNLYHEVCPIPAPVPAGYYHTLVSLPTDWYHSSAHAAIKAGFGKNHCLDFGRGMRIKYDNATGRTLLREAKMGISGGGYGVYFEASQKTDYQESATLTFQVGKYNGRLCGLYGLPKNGDNSYFGTVMLSR